MNMAVKKTSLCLIFTFSSLRLTDDDHWVIDTDYDNYAIHYSCRQVDDDGTCLDSYSFIFSRHLTGLRPEDQSIVQDKKTELCLQNKYRRTNHNGELKAKSIWLCKGFFFAAIHKAVLLIGWDKGESQWFTLAQTPWLQPILFPHKFLVFSRLILLFFPSFNCRLLQQHMICLHSERKKYPPQEARILLLPMNRSPPSSSLLHHSSLPKQKFQGSQNKQIKRKTPTVRIKRKMTAVTRLLPK